MTTIPEALAIAIQHHQNGRLQAAEQIYRQILQIEPNKADALHLLGVIAYQVGKHEIAAQYIGRAIQLEPDYAEAHSNLGLALAGQGKVEEALACYRRALQLKPDYAEGHNNLGIALKELGKLDEAVDCYLRALELKPDYAIAHVNLGNALRDQGKLDEAIDCYRRALQLKPDYAEALYNLGAALRDQGKLDEAIDCYRQALQIKPDYAEAANNLGTALRDQGKLDEAVAFYLRALHLKPDHAEAHNNLGTAFYDQGKLDEAVACYLRALQFKPDCAEAHNNLGLAFYHQGKPEEAADCYRHALQLKPDYAEAHNNLALVQLLTRNWEQGWSEFEWRKKTKRSGFRTFPQPPWDGISLIGKTILLHAEQGFGDTLQFIRYAPLVQQQGGRVLFECPAELAGIVQSCPGIDKIVTLGTPLPPFDVQAPLLSLPSILKTTLDTVPASIPYLSADRALTERWRQELSRYAGFKIGIVWQGNPRFSQPESRVADQKRSIPLACFEPLARLPGVRLFSLQKGFGTEQLTKRQTPFGIIDLGDRLMDFMETAAVMMNLDLIISADTSPLHLAGALGRPVWAVLSFTSCWRWLQDRKDSPWYPTMRLFRQRKPGDWGDVFERIAAGIRVFSPGSKNRGGSAFA